MEHQFVPIDQTLNLSHRNDELSLFENNIPQDTDRARNQMLIEEDKEDGDRVVQAPFFILRAESDDSQSDDLSAVFDNLDAFMV